MEPGFTIYQPPHGFVRYIDHLGSDMRVLETARLSHKSASKGEEKDIGLLHYLMRNRHTSPFEGCNATFNIKFPIFLMRQFVRHRTFRLNEQSARYSELEPDYYYPLEWREQDTKNKQGSIESRLGPHWQSENTALMNEAYRTADSCYRELLKRGVSKEQARFIMPVGIYTEIFVNIDLHNLMHFFRLRLDAHAQAEMRVVAEAMFQIAQELFPWTIAAFHRFKIEVKDVEVT